MSLLRRKFLRQSVALTGALALANHTPLRAMAGTPPLPGTLRLNYAPHQGMFAAHAGQDVLNQIRFMHQQGFRAIEDNGMLARPVSQQEKIGQLLTELGMTMGVFVVDGGDNWKTSLTTGKQAFIDTFLNTCRACEPVARRVNAKWLTVVPGFYNRALPTDIQTAHVIEALRLGAEVFEPYGLVMVLEPLSDTPELFLRHSTQAYMICKAVNSPACKILFDVYHMQRNEGDLIANINKCWDEIAYIQVGDNPGRKEPGTGEINYQNLFKHIYLKGYTGVVGMEHGLAHGGKQGELALIEAYRTVDGFAIE